ncbi:MAG: hypothetical protein R3Y47_04380 [Lachnospiraceae bacterium]
MKHLTNTFNKLTLHKTWVDLVLMCIIYALFPYAYLFVLSFLFDYVLEWYFMDMLLRGSFYILLVVVIALIIFSIRNFIKKQKKK